MQCYGKESVGNFIAVHYNGQVEAYMQGYSKSSVGPYLTVHYNG
jgi:hypothetical protein